MSWYQKQQNKISTYAYDTIRNGWHIHIFSLPIPSNTKQSKRGKRTIFFLSFEFDDLLYICCACAGIVSPLALNRKESHRSIISHCLRIFPCFVLCLRIHWLWIDYFLHSSASVSQTQKQIKILFLFYIFYWFATESKIRKTKRKFAIKE